MGVSIQNEIGMTREFSPPWNNPAIATIFSPILLNHSSYSIATLTMAEETAVTSTTLTTFPKIAEGKVRDLYEVDSKTLLFVASDRISAYDVVMENVPSPSPPQSQLANKHRASPQKANS
jgi:hypothetical protein